MPAISASASGKLILCGEHAVVYGKPAIAIPVFDILTNVKILARPTATTTDTVITAPKIALKTELSRLAENHPIKRTIDLVLNSLRADHLPSCEIIINSSIPPAAGLGSSASTTVALIRAVSSFMGHPLENEKINEIAFEIETIHHGTPSGIDNTVITYAKPIYFRKGNPFELLDVKQNISLIIADSGIKSSTSKVVSEVRSHWEKEPDQYNSFFDQIQEICNKVKQDIKTGDLVSLGNQLTLNHILLREMQISCPELDQLVEAAMKSGALGAKLSGGGQGGNMLALVTPENKEKVIEALRNAGAVNTINTCVPSDKGSIV